MQPISRANVNRLNKYLKDLKDSNPKPAFEIDLNVLSNLMSRIGFKGPFNKPGTARAFSHELLKNEPMLIDGQFTVHISGKKVVTIRYRDFKQYVRPHIEHVIAILEQNDLITEEESSNA